MPVERWNEAARFPAFRSLDASDLPAMPSVNRRPLMRFEGCEYVDRRENVVAFGNSGTRKTHVALCLGLASCQKELRFEGIGGSGFQAPRLGTCSHPQDPSLQGPSLILPI